MAFGAALRLLRQESGLSLRDLARRLGVSGAYLSRVENGLDPAPTPARLHALSLTLGLPARLLLDLAHRVSPLVTDYVDRVPEAGALFLEIAQRGLDAHQVDALRREVMRTHPLPGDAARAGANDEGHLAPLLSAERVLLRFSGLELGDVIDVAAGRLGLPNPTAVAQALRRREADQPSRLGGGVAVPGLPLPQHPARAVLVLLDPPLPEATPDGRPLALVWVWAGAASPRARLLRLARLAALADRGLAQTLAALSRPEQVLAALAHLDAGLD